MPPEKERLQSPEERDELNGLYECILCASCSTALPELLVEPRQVRRPGRPAAGLFPLGTTGESPALDDDEIDELVERTVAKVAGRVPVFVGVGGNATPRSRRR